MLNLGAIVVSIAVQKGVSAVVIMRDGRVVRRHIERVALSDQRVSIYSNLIQVFSSSLRLLRNYLESDSTCRDVIFEIYSSTFLKWLDSGVASGEYRGKFADSMELLQSLPIRYNFVHKEPVAKMYADLRYVGKRLQVGNLDISGIDDDGMPLKTYGRERDFVENDVVGSEGGVQADTDTEDWGSDFTDDWVKGQGSVSSDDLGEGVNSLYDIYDMGGDRE